MDVWVIDRVHWSYTAGIRDISMAISNVNGIYAFRAHLLKEICTTSGEKTIFCKCCKLYCRPFYIFTWQEETEDWVGCPIHREVEVRWCNFCLKESRLMNRILAKHKLDVLIQTGTSIERLLNNECEADA